jgi:SPASM domain peptide maturase of grasp-with-spasm system
MFFYQILKMMQTSENESKYFKLFGNCVPVSGANRSIICDLYRNDYCYVPNEFIEFYSLGDSLFQNKISMGEELFQTYYEYVEYLISKDLGFITDTPDEFPSIDFSWDYPSHITNAIIDLSEDINGNIYGYENFINGISYLNCHSLVIRVFNIISENSIIKLLKITQDSRIKSIELFLPSIIFNEVGLENIIIDNKKIVKVVLFGAKDNSTSEVRNVSVFKLKGKLISENSCGIINRSYFNSTIEHFTEALNFNTCLNRKISVDSKGLIKNCPASMENYGSIFDEFSLINILEGTNIKETWNISKDQIEVCKDCEFRYICMDCRTFIENNDNILSKPLKCGYNPYTSIWNNWEENAALKKNNEM